MTRNSTAVGRYPSLLTLIAVLVGAAIAVQASEIRVATGPWPDSMPTLPAQKSMSSPPLFIRIDLTLVEEALTISSNDREVTVIGEVRNDEEGLAWLLPLAVAGLDADGELVDSVTVTMVGADSFASAELPHEWVAPGTTGWFSAALSNIPESPIETVLVRAQGMMINQKSGDVASPETSAGLEMAGDWQIEQTGWELTLTGLVRNLGPEDVVGLRVATVFRDPAGAMVEFGSKGQPGEVIGGYLGGVPAGGEVPVRLWFYTDPDVFATAAIETRLSAFTIGDPEHHYAILGIGHLQGLGGTTWRSSIELVNRSGATANAVLTYRYEDDQTNAFSFVDLEDGEAFQSSDVAAELFGVEEPSSGYVLIRSNTPLQISGRTSNETQIGGYGQVLPVVTPEMTYDLGPSEGLMGVLSGLRGDPSFRTNIGLVNLGNEACSAHVIIHDAAGQTVSDWGWVELERTEWNQVNRAIPSDLDTAYATVEPEPGCPIWAYASVIEEGTNDPVTISLQRVVEIDLRPEEIGFRFVIPWAR